MVDCDLYESACSVLNFLSDLVRDGTVLIFDDWHVYRGNSLKGEQRAFNEWLAANPQLKATEFQKFSWHGNSFIIHIPESL